MAQKKTKFVGFRVDSRMHDFLKEFARENKLEVSSLCRNVITYFFMGYLIGDYKIVGLKEKFLQKLKSQKGQKVKQ